MGHTKLVRERARWSLSNSANLHALTTGPQIALVSRTASRDVATGQRHVWFGCVSNFKLRGSNFNHAGGSAELQGRHLCQYLHVQPMECGGQLACGRTTEVWASFQKSSVGGSWELALELRWVNCASHVSIGLNVFPHPSAWRPQLQRCSGSCVGRTPV